MSDIVDRLRALASWTEDNQRAAIAWDAADEIEKLRAALRFWIEAYRSRKSEPLIIAYESTLNRFPDMENRAALGNSNDK